MKHPNATAAGTAAGVVGAVLWLLEAAGVDVPEPPVHVTVWIGGAVSAVVLVIGRDGLRGLARRIWRGETK